MPPVQHFVRAEMLPSGYLIRPCEGGGSIIHIVDHMDLEVTFILFGKNYLVLLVKFGLFSTGNEKLIVYIYLIV